MPDNLDILYNMLQSGIPLETAYALLEITDDQIKDLETDKAFLRKVKFYEASYERQLLDRIEHVMDINEGRGISTEARWLLARKYPQRWGGRQIVINNPAPSGALPNPNVEVYDDEPEDSGENDDEGED